MAADVVVVVGGLNENAVAGVDWDKPVVNENPGVAGAVPAGLVLKLNHEYYKWHKPMVKINWQVT